MKNTCILEFKNIHIGFEKDSKHTPFIEDMNFRLQEGECMGIVGESGSGKTLTALSVPGLLPSPPVYIQKGSILFNRNGEVLDLVKLREKDMQSIRGKMISMIFQEPLSALNPVYTAGQQVAEILERHTKSGKSAIRKKVLDLFAEVRLDHPEKMYRSYPHQLSGGQRQRVMIAMAIACDPLILIADEPTTALDVSVQSEIIDLLKDIQKDRGMSILFISHDFGVIRKIAHKVLVMHKGKLVEQGNTEEIVNRPREMYTKALLACRPPLDDRPYPLPTVESYQNIQKTGETNQLKSKDGRELLLHVEDLDVSFTIRRDLLGRPKKKFEAVKKLSFDLYKGETLGLVGESGCGKTSLGRSILGLIQTSGGRILYRGEEISRMSRRERKSLCRKMQIIFQDPFSSLNPRQTISGILTEVVKAHRLCRSKKECKERVMELLQEVHLDASYYSKYPHQLSGGQRQRVGIARALAVEPEFIICDESVSALDVSIQAQVLNLLNELKEKLGLTYIFISHDLSVVKYMSDRLIVMEKGEIAEYGEAGKIFRSPQSAISKKLISSIPDVH